MNSLNTPLPRAAPINISDAIFSGFPLFQFQIGSRFLTRIKHNPNLYITSCIAN